MTETTGCLRCRGLGVLPTPVTTYPRMQDVCQSCNGDGESFSRIARLEVENARLRTIIDDMAEDERLLMASACFSNDMSWSVEDVIAGIERRTRGR